MRKNQEFKIQEKTSKKLDETILLQAELRLSELRDQHKAHSSKSIFAMPRWVFATAASFAVVVILFTANSMNNYYFSSADLNEIANSPIEAYSDLELDLMHDKDLIEQDLNILADNDSDYENE